MQFVTVTDGGWDTHTNNFRSLKDRLLPRLDRGFSALLEDLADRGLLDDTLVVWFGDFGRTPKVNPSAGRDHWATAGVALLGGGGVKGGQVVGRDERAGRVRHRQPGAPAGPGRDDLHVLGRAAAHVVQDAGRPADRAGARRASR